MNTFNDICKFILKESDEDLDQNFSYYVGPEQEIMLLDDLDASTLKRRVEQGHQFKTVHIATKKDAVNYGYPDQQGHSFYVFYQAQDFTKPALIPF